MKCWTHAPRGSNTRSEANLLCSGSQRWLLNQSTTLGENFWKMFWCCLEYLQRHVADKLSKNVHDQGEREFVIIKQTNQIANPSGNRNVLNCIHYGIIGHWLFSLNCALLVVRQYTIWAGIIPVFLYSLQLRMPRPIKCPRGLRPAAS